MFSSQLPQGVIGAVIPQENARREMYFSIIPAKRVRKLGVFIFFKPNHSLAKGCPWEDVDLQALSAATCTGRVGSSSQRGALQQRCRCRPEEVGLECMERLMGPVRIWMQFRHCWPLH